MIVIVVVIIDIPHKSLHFSGAIEFYRTLRVGYCAEHQ